MDTPRIHRFQTDYIEYNPFKWRWEIINEKTNIEKYEKFRARYSPAHTSADIWPDFLSIEKDADNLRMSRVEWTDICGIRWYGEKGINTFAGTPDGIGSLYYMTCDEDGEMRMNVSDEYATLGKLPPVSEYFSYTTRGITHYVDYKDIAGVEYQYVVNNHIFKDTSIVINYKDGDTERIFDAAYDEFIKVLKDHNETDLLDKIFAEMDVHFDKMRKSESYVIRDTAPKYDAAILFSK